MSKTLENWHCSGCNWIGPAYPNCICDEANKAALVRVESKRPSTSKAQDIVSRHVGFATQVLIFGREKLTEAISTALDSERKAARTIVQNIMEEWGHSICERVNMGDATMDEIVVDLALHSKLKERLDRALEGQT